eukprot:scaffold9753_cov83-Skeletonema_dohrnii-CCMP3373.AAC.2
MISTAFTYNRFVWLHMRLCPCFHALRTESPALTWHNHSTSKQPNESSNNMKLLINSPFLIALLSASAAIYSPHPHAHAYVRGEGEGISDLRHSSRGRFSQLQLQKQQRKQF